jgi:hypothetical protein
MKRFLLITLLGLVGLASCALPETPPVNAAPTDAGAFARMRFASLPEKVFPALRDSVENGTGDMLITNVFTGRNGVAAYWQKIAGQSARVYFTIIADGEKTLIKVSTVPARAPEAQLLARSLNIVGNDVADRLSLKDFSLEPDK